jgi:hypothetical protein
MYPDRTGIVSNSRVHLSGGSVTALARKPMMMNHHLMPPGPRRASPAGDANVRLLNFLTRSFDEC